MDRPVPVHNSPSPWDALCTALTSVHKQQRGGFQPLTIDGMNDKQMNANQELHSTRKGAIDTFSSYEVLLHITHHQ